MMQIPEVGVFIRAYIAVKTIYTNRLDAKHSFKYKAMRTAEDHIPIIAYATFTVNHPVRITSADTFRGPSAFSGGKCSW